MATANDNATHNDTPTDARMNFAPIYQLSPKATAADIGNHIDLQLARLRSMLLAVTGNDDPLEDLTEDVKKEYLFACADLVEEVRDLRRFVRFGERQ